MLIGTFARNNEQIMDALKHNPDFIDLRMDLNHSIIFKDAKREMEEAGVGFTLHLPSNPDWTPIDMHKDIIPFIDIGAQIGAELVTFHSTLSTLFYTDEEIDQFLQSVPLAYDAAKEVGVKLAVETLGHYYTELTLLFDVCPNMNIALDIGHGQILANRNRALAIIESFYNRIAMINVHDNNGSDMIEELINLKKKKNLSQEEIRDIAHRYDTHLSINEGNIDFSTIFRELKERHYDDKFLMMHHNPNQFLNERDKFMKIWLDA